MKIVTHDEVGDHQRTELTLACFDYPYSGEIIKEITKVDPRVPNWGGDLYVKEGEKVLGMLKVLFPRARTKNGTEKVGGIGHVCTRPSASRRGVATRLFEEAERVMKEEGFRFSFLNTSKSLVAYNLYRKLGYRDILAPPKAYKKIEKGETRVEFKKVEGPDYIQSTYQKSVEGLTGLIAREDKFWNIAEVHGFPENENVKVAYEEGRKIGYVMYEKKKNWILCSEVAAKKKENVPQLLKALESKTNKKFVVLNFLNPNYTDLTKNCGFNYHGDMWKRVMVKDFEENFEETFDLFGQGETFHIGIYEYY
ncbi:hypothetical protein AKJ57_01185 [candidate division MSBL1 archaeon SCGC-AAA259A05]|uniref:N-acetyltransferase domain-containing protein n=1 Tax=candidate division MSBL1 archaeon SCGC-AAA259A05 TaxID=1698259 RepID=A0A133UBB5_9EURY|nr:hypothetical protein AKJ57_01185 [candidate division MSBL1 archaeon SCGC-AAA259A05]